MYITYPLTLFVNMGSGIRKKVSMFHYQSGKSQGIAREFYVGYWV